MQERWEGYLSDHINRSPISEEEDEQILHVDLILLFADLTLHIVTAQTWMGCDCKSITVTKTRKSHQELLEL
jgi:hypothetical protein